MARKLMLFTGLSVLLISCAQPLKQTNKETKKMNFQENVTFENGACEIRHSPATTDKTAGITLAGTLTIPNGQGPFPAVLLISGMGPNDRDYTMFNGNKLFLVLADYLTQKGIAVLRYDKRGVGKSTGTFNLTVTSKDFAGDALAGVEYLKSRKEIDTTKIGLIGHSEGGMIAPMVAAESPDVAFVVSMAGPVATGVDDVVAHAALQLRADGASEELIALDGPMRRKMLDRAVHELDYDKAAQQMHAIIAEYLKTLPETQKTESEKFLFAITQANANDMIQMFNSPWYRYFLTYNPVATLKKIKIPVLAINGNLDFIASSHIMLPIIARALKDAGNNDYTVTELPQLNHWFQTCKTGAMMEYGAIKEVISPLALDTMSEWILARFGK